VGRHLINTFTAVAVSVAQLGLASPSFAQSEAAFEVARRVNIAGRQRMLSQRMSKAACFVSLGVEPETQRSQLQSAFDLFSTSREALLSGSTDMGLSLEDHPEILESYEPVGRDWSFFSPLIEIALGEGTVDKSALKRIDQVGVVLLANLNRAVNKTANFYGEAHHDMPLLLSITIDLAGRQRMFSQKAAKEFCLADAGVDDEANRANLATTANLFTLTLQALIDGMPGMVMGAPNDEIRQKLEAVAAAWQGPHAVLVEVGNGGAITDEQRRVIANDMEQVLVLMNQAVAMYEDAIPSE